MALGWAFKLGPNEYLLLGVPLTAAFQLGVRRQPLRALWVRSAPPLRVTPQWLLVTAALAALPAYELYQGGFRGGWVPVAWLGCAILGAAAAAYAIQHAGRRVARSVPPALTMVVLISALMLFVGLTQRGLAVLSGSALLVIARWGLLYFAVSFLLEEVTFRGALDAHLYRPEDRRGGGSAVALSFLWGVWHLPVVPVEGVLLLAAVRLGLWHMLVGFPLSISWRIGGNLLVPAAAHAFINGVRNATLLVP
jgi:hypothetical protein